MTDYNFLMESRLSPAQFHLVNDLSRIAYGVGVNLYLVGGAVRDMTFGQAVVRDLDFAVEGDIQKILRHLRFDGSKKKSTGKSTSAWEHGPAEVTRSRIDKRKMTADLWFSNGVQAEIAQCHEEIVLKPGRPPQVVPAMIFDDLKGRDFAFNAMAISLHPNSRGLLLDPKNGAGDIERREIRVLSLRSFWEDPIRIYRLFRLGLRLGFQPEEKTARWLNSALEDRAWTDLAPEEQGREIEAVMQEENPERVLKLYAEQGILIGLDKSLVKIPYDRFRKIAALSRKFPGEDFFLLNFDCLASKLSGPQKQKLAKKVLSDPKTVKLALNMDREAKKLSRALASSKCATPSQAYKVLSQHSRPLLLFLLAYYPQAKIQSQIKHFMVKASQIRANLPERELAELGVKPGPKFDRILERIFFDQLDGKIKTHPQISKELRQLAGVKEPSAAPTVPPVSPRPAKSTRASGKGRLAKIARAAAKQRKRKSSRG